MGSQLVEAFPSPSASISPGHLCSEEEGPVPWLTFLRGALAFGQGRMTSGAGAFDARIATRDCRKSCSASSATIRHAKVTGARHGVCQSLGLPSTSYMLRWGHKGWESTQVSVRIEIIGTSRNTGLVEHSAQVADAVAVTRTAKVSRKRSIIVCF
jgi:hypothetical protein